MLFKDLEAHVGNEAAQNIFPEYAVLPEKMSVSDQATLIKRVMGRMIDTLDYETVKKIRRTRPCKMPKEQKHEMTEVMKNCKDIDEFLSAYGYIKQDDGTYLSNYKQAKCWCGAFHSLDEYEPVSIAWCECCNAHHENGLMEICGRPVKTEIIESIVSGGRDCVYRVFIQNEPNVETLAAMAEA